jgi:hypothetical protein
LEKTLNIKQIYKIRQFNIYDLSNILFVYSAKEIFNFLKDKNFDKNNLKVIKNNI